jgi:uncharacterized integral membrane protein (TIGR00698 family)
LNKLSKLFPSLIFLIVVAIIANVISLKLNEISILISSTFLAVILGILIRNTKLMNSNIDEFASIGLKHILKVGIVFLGIRLSFHEFLNYGVSSILIIIINNILLVFIFLTLVRNILKIKNSLTYLIAIGTGICGVTAIIAASSVIKSNKNEISYAVGVITLFGLITMFAYPYLAHILFENDSIKAGIFLGTSIHDTAQVTAAGMNYAEIFKDQKVFDAAITTKLIRNSFLVIAIPILAIMLNNKKNTKIKNSFINHFPFFVFGFVFFVLVRSLGDIYLINHEVYFSGWSTIIFLLENLSKWFILIAMVALGIKTDLTQIVNLGPKPLLAGFAAAILVGMSSIAYLMFLN